MGSNRTLWRKLMPPIVVLGSLVALWHAAVSWGWVYSWEIPSPAAVVHEAIAIWPRLMEHTRATLQLTLLGFAGGTAAGFVLAAVLHLIPGVRAGVYPLLILSQNIPFIVIAPMMSMLFGYGLLPKVLLIMMVCFFPILIAMLNGLANTDAGLRNYLQMIGGSKWQLFWRLELPYSITHLFSGLKIAASYSVLSAVVAEWLAPKIGLGGFMVLSARGYMPARVFAAVIIIVAISLMLFGLVVLAERCIIRWQPRKERVES